MSAPARKYKILSTLEVSIGFKWPIIFVLVKGKIKIPPKSFKTLTPSNDQVCRPVPM